MKYFEFYRDIYWYLVNQFLNTVEKCRAQSKANETKSTARSRSSLLETKFSLIVLHVDRRIQIRTKNNGSGRPKKLPGIGTCP